MDGRCLCSTTPISRENTWKYLGTKSRWQASERHEKSSWEMPVDIWISSTSSPDAMNSFFYQPKLDMDMDMDQQELDKIGMYKKPKSWQFCGDFSVLPTDSNRPVAPPEFRPVASPGPAPLLPQSVTSASLKPLRFSPLSDKVIRPWRFPTSHRAPRHHPVIIQSSSWDIFP